MFWQKLTSLWIFISRLCAALCLLFGLYFAPLAQAGEVNIAAASNFKSALDELASHFEAQSGDKVSISTGSTGLLYAQIQNGAPFDIFLAADSERPARLYENNFAAAQPMTYALGKLALWQSGSAGDKAQAPETRLKDRSFNYIAIANPKLAPYGAAAQHVLETLNLQDTIKDQMVYGENIAQTFAFVYTGNADLGFVSYAQILTLSPDIRGEFWLPPVSTYPPIRQDAVWLARAADSAAAKSFYAFLQSRQARDIILKHGYDLP